MKKEVLNKIEITSEALFDYECCIGKRKQPSWDAMLRFALGDSTLAFDLFDEWENTRELDKKTLKAEVEEYINRMNRGGRLLYENYFRCKWYDEQTGLMLMLFLYRTTKMSVMQFWEVRGICKEADWSEEAEEDGYIRNWINSRIADLNCEYDWVEELRIRQEKNKLEEELEKIYEREWCQQQCNEHNRRFDKEGTKDAQAQLADIRDERKRLESQLRINKLRLKGYAGASRIY